ncbi:hypothetical protein [Rhodococcoides yunnanense]|uniref:Uncharacterized protein n=1 Tax=Rhodococcoides yunnanense TaxID=278209 RepID=A0ABU4BG06_9NOCA|nr:hypothetical protein [Rhodococcus yunnanensis]MDV6263019.1 hypothetical protein [Rhodococcus yunnanensis]
MTRKRFEYFKVGLFLICAILMAWAAGTFGSIYYALMAALFGAVTVFVVWRVDKFETQ